MRLISTEPTVRELVAIHLYNQFKEQHNAQGAILPDWDAPGVMYWLQDLFLKQADALLHYLRVENVNVHFDQPTEGHSKASFCRYTHASVTEKKTDPDGKEYCHACRGRGLRGDIQNEEACERCGGCGLEPKEDEEQKA